MKWINALKTPVVLVPLIVALGTAAGLDLSEFEASIIAGVFGA